MDGAEFEYPLNNGSIDADLFGGLPTIRSRQVLVAPKKEESFIKKHGVLIGLLLLLLAILAAGALFFRAHYMAQPSPFAVDIANVADPDARADLIEWQRLWQMARRPTIREVLKNIVTDATTTSSSSSSSSSQANGTRQRGAPPGMDMADDDFRTEDPPEDRVQQMDDRLITLVGGGAVDSDPNFGDD